MIFLIILLLGIYAFIVVFIYQEIMHSKINIFLKFFFVFFLVIFLMSVAYYREKQIAKDSLEGSILSPIAAPIEQGVAMIHYVTKVQRLESVIKPVFQNEEGIYAVGIKNLKTGDEYYYNESKRFKSASIYKLWVMATVFQFIQDGKITPTKVLSQDIASLNKVFGIASESAELKEGGITRTVMDAVEDMIEYSSNYAAYLLTYTIKVAPITNMLRTLELNDSKMSGEPYTTVTDIVHFYEKLYKGQIVSQSASKEMLEILKKQQLNDRIPKYLPKGTVVAHKTGELDGVKHNAGIVYSPKGDYIIVLFSDTDLPLHAAEVEAQISKKAWDYFNN